MLQLLPHLGRGATTWSEAIMDPSSYGDAVQWWTIGLNEFSGY
jgi:hypothetical protein